MWQFQQNIYRTKNSTVINSNSFEVGEGDCENEPTTWNLVYSSSNIPLSNGDVLFIEPQLVNTYNGNDLKHRERQSGGTPTQRDFNVSMEGVVSNVANCENMPSEEIVVNEQQEELDSGSCTTCASITVPVPANSSRQVEFIKAGIGPYGTVGSLCTNIGTGVTSDNIFNITEDTSFDFGVDAAKGSQAQNTATTTISVIVRDGSTVVDTFNLSRTHRDPVINC